MLTSGEKGQSYERSKLGFESFEERCEGEYVENNVEDV
jgi:hypothetical protein